MKKILLSTLFFLSFFMLPAQGTSFGVSLGGNFSTAFTDGSSNIIDAESDFTSNFHFGAYLDHAITEKLGLKTNVIFVKREIPTFSTSFIDDVSLRTLDLTPLLKYNFNDSYDEGFSLLFGPRISFLLSSEANGIDVDNAFKSTNFGVQLGIEKTIYKYLNLELKVDYGFSTTDEEVVQNNIGFITAFLSLNIDVKSLLEN